MDKKKCTLAFFTLVMLFTGINHSNVYAVDTDSPTDILVKAKQQIVIQNLSNVKDNLTLPSKVSVDGKEVDISWQSDKENVISGESGYVKRQATNELVTLTATLKYNSYEDADVFKAMVRASNSNPNLLQMKVIDALNIQLTFDNVPSTDKEDYTVALYGLTSDVKVPVKAVTVDNCIATLSVNLSSLSGELIVNDLPILDLIDFSAMPSSSSDIKLSLVSKTAFKLGKVVDITINTHNSASYDEGVPVCIALFNADTNTIIKYTCALKSVASGDDWRFNSKIKVPDSGNYYLKYFIMDNVDSMQQVTSSDAIPLEK